MKKLLPKSVQVVNSNIALVILVSVSNIQMFAGVMAYLSVLGLIVSFVIGIIIYGRIVAHIEGSIPLPGIKIFKENWLNYMIVAVLLSIPMVLYVQFAKLFPMSMELSIYGKEGTRALVNILTIYVLPIVFIKRQHFVAILAGITYLFQSFKISIPIIFLIIVMYILNSAVLFWFISQAKQEGVFSLLPAMFLFNIIVTYLSYLIFTAASIVLIESSRESAGYGA